MNINKLLKSKSVMAIINCTPDSFYAESRLGIDAVLEVCKRHIEQGANILDVGGYSSRPGANEVTVEEELGRVLPVIEFIGEKFPEIFISIDTFRKRVAEQAIQAGAHIVNDITGGDGDIEMLDFICETKTPYVLMHMRGTPQSMQSLCNYDDLIGDIVSELSPKMSRLKTADVPLIIDPGFGFAKTLKQNYELLSRLEELRTLDVPILVGFSRKSMIYKLLDVTPEQALNGTTVLNTIALQKGASILRVHDTLEAVECIKLTTYP